MLLLSPPAYGLRHDKIVSLSKLGRSCSQPIPFRMAKTLCITQWEIKRETVRLADGAASKAVELADENSVTRIGYLLV